MVVLLLLLLLCSSCGVREPWPSVRRPEFGLTGTEVVLFYTGDIHGAFADIPVVDEELGETRIGGFAALSAHLARERPRTKHSLLLDAGDLMTGNPICDYERSGVRGGVLVEFMNQVGYDAMALGHHEFDLGPRNLDGLMRLARFPFLSANTRRPDGSLRVDAAYRIFDLDSVRVAVVGLTTEELPWIVARSSLAGTRVEPAAAALLALMPELRLQADLIVILSHLGLQGDRKLAREVPGIDVIVGGHDHLVLQDALVENGTIIVQAGAQLQVLGRLRLTLGAEGIVAHHNEQIRLQLVEGADPELEREVRRHAKRIEREYGRVIGNLAVPWTRQRSAESNVGSWICDRLQEYVKSDFAVYNSGGLRKDVPAGPVSQLDVLEMLPFANMVVTFECTGSELLRLIETNVRAATSGEHSILQVSGIRYTYASDGNGNVRLLSTSLGRRRIDPLRTYVGATVDYVLFSNPARYFGFDPASKSVEGTLLSDVIVHAVETARGPITARLDERIRSVTWEEAGLNPN